MTAVEPTMKPRQAHGIGILGKIRPEYLSILSIPAQEFLATLHRTFEPRRQELIHLRYQRQLDLDRGVFPEFLPETESIRNDVAWKGALPAPGLVDRRVEITGPVDRKMVINALNCGATQFMADFEGNKANDLCSYFLN